MFTIAIRKIGESIDIDFDSLPAESVRYVVAYGLTQIFNDAHASVVKKSYDPAKNDGTSFEAAVMDKVAARLDSLRDGEVPGARTPADPKKAEAKRRAAQLSALTPDEFNELLARFTESKTAA